MFVVGSAFSRVAFVWLGISTALCLANDPASIDFNRDLKPLLSKHCLACHNANDSEGGLNLESYSPLMAGGDSGAAVTAGQPDESLLIERVLDDADPMPPADNTVGAKRLTPDEVELLRRWIASGAAAPAADAPRDVQWQTLPAGLEPVIALTVSPDGNYVSFGRGSRVVVAPHAPAAQPAVAQLATTLPAASRTHALEDPSLQSLVAGPTTHLDIVQSLAFSPDSQRLATGGFRSVKIWRRQTEPTRELSGLSKPGKLSQFAPTGRHLAQALSPNVLEVTDCQSGQVHRFLKTHASEITSLAWLTPDLLLSGDASGKLFVTDAREFQVLSVEIPAPKTCQLLRPLSDTRALAVDDKGWLYELTLSGGASETSRDGAFRKLEGFVSVVDVALSGDGTRVAVGLADRTVRMVTVSNWKVTQEFKLESAIGSLALNGDGSLLAVTPEKGTLQVLETQKGEVIATPDQDYHGAYALRGATAKLERQTAAVKRLEQQLDDLRKAVETEKAAAEKLLQARDQAAEALASKAAELTDSQSQLFDTEQAFFVAQQAAVEPEDQIKEQKVALEKKRTEVSELEASKTAADGELAQSQQALTSAQENVQRAEVKVPAAEEAILSEKAKLARLQAEVESAKSEALITDVPTAAAFTPDGSQVVVAYGAQRLRVFNAWSGAPFASLASSEGCQTMRVTSSGELVALDDHGSARAWDLNFPWQLEWTLGSTAESPFSDRITALDFNHDGSQLAVGGGPPSRFGDIQLVDMSSRQVIRDFGKVHGDSVLGLRFSPDGNLLVSSGADKLCHVFDVASGAKQRTLEGHTHHVLSIAWHADGHVLLTGSADATVKVWNVEDGTQRRTVSGFDNEITSVSYIDRSDQFVLVSADGSVQLYDAESGKRVRAFDGAEQSLHTLAVAPQGEHVYAGGQAGLIWVWQLSDAKLIKTYPQ